MGWLALRCDEKRGGGKKKELANEPGGLLVGDEFANGRVEENAREILGAGCCDFRALEMERRAARGRVRSVPFILICIFPVGKSLLCSSMTMLGR